MCNKVKTKREKKFVTQLEMNERNRRRRREKDCVCNRETTIDFEGNLKFEFET
jgi:hypothetical protein